MTRPRSSSRGRNTNESVTVTVTYVLLTFCALLILCVMMLRFLINTYIHTPV